MGITCSSSAAINSIESDDATIKFIRIKTNLHNTELIIQPELPPKDNNYSKQCAKYLKSYPNSITTTLEQAKFDLVRGFVDSNQDKQLAMNVIAKILLKEFGAKHLEIPSNTYNVSSRGSLKEFHTGKTHHHTKEYGMEQQVGKTGSIPIPNTILSFLSAANQIQKFSTTNSSQENISILLMESLNSNKEICFPKPNQSKWGIRHYSNGNDCRSTKNCSYSNSLDLIPHSISV